MPGPERICADTAQLRLYTTDLKVYGFGVRGVGVELGGSTSEREHYSRVLCGREPTRGVASSFSCHGLSIFWVFMPQALTFVNMHAAGFE